MQANTKTKTTEPVILMRERAGKWRQYLVVRDRAVTIVEMVPAYLGGWNFGRIIRQGDRDWSMTRDQIVAWKMANDDGLTTIVADLPADFRAKLLAK